jgi:tRNA/tmRNA/rRNA uracil-C5-methylase (TrmA/RlmC/RlmD family)
MYRRVAQFLAKDGAPGPYADLYAGAGGFSRALLGAGAADVVAVERAGESAAGLFDLPVEALEQSVEYALPALAARGAERAWVGVVADPPKKGLGAAAAGIAALGATRVALVACDPDSGARDARAFLAVGYALVAVEALDLFPGTPEVETLFLLERG